MNCDHGVRRQWMVIPPRDGRIQLICSTCGFSLETRFVGLDASREFDTPSSNWREGLKNVGHIEKKISKAEVTSHPSLAEEVIFDPNISATGV